MPPFRPRQFSQGSDAEWDQVLAHPHVKQAFQDPRISNALGHVLQQPLGIGPQGYADGGSVGIPDPQTVSKFQQLQEELRDEYEPMRYDAGGITMDLSNKDEPELLMLEKSLSPTDPLYARVEAKLAEKRAERGSDPGGFGVRIPGMGNQNLSGLSKLTEETPFNRNASLILGGMMGLGVQGNISPMARIASALLGAGMAYGMNKYGRRAIVSARQKKKLEEDEAARAAQAVDTHEPQLQDKRTQPPPQPPPPPPPPPPLQPDRNPIPTVGGPTATPPATTGAPTGVPTANAVNNAQTLSDAANNNQPLPPASFGAAPNRTPREQSGLGLYSQYDPSQGGGAAAGLSSTQSGQGHWSGYEPKTGRQIQSTDGTNWTYAGTNTPYAGNTVFQKTEDWGPSGSAPASSAIAATGAAPPPKNPADSSAMLLQPTQPAQPRTWAQAIDLARKNREESIAQGNYGFVPRGAETAVDRALQKQYGIEEAATGTLPSQLLMPGDMPGSPYPDSWPTEIPGAALAAADQGYYARGGEVHGDAAQDRAQMLSILKEKKLIKKARGGFASDAEAPPLPMKKGKSPLIRKPPKHGVPAIAIIITASKKPPGKEGGRKKKTGGKIELSESQLDKSARKPRAVPPKHGPMNGDQYAPYKKGGRVQVPRGSGAATRGKRFSGIY